MNKVWFSIILAIVFSLSSFFSQASVPVQLSSELEEIIQQLDWDMTRVGNKGQKHRNRAVRKLTCIGQMGGEEKMSVLHTIGRLLGHENELVVKAAAQIFENLSEPTEGYLQEFRVRSRPLQNWSDMQDVLGDLSGNKLEGLEIIHESYPTLGEVQRMNELVDLFFHRTGHILKIRLRVFSFNPPTQMEWTAIYSLRGQITSDFHVGPEVPVDFICPVMEAEPIDE